MSYKCECKYDRISDVGGILVSWGLSLSYINVYDNKWDYCRV